MIFTTSLTGRVRTGDFNPQQHPQLVGEVVHTRVNPCDMDADEITAEPAHGLEMELDLLPVRPNGLVEDPVEVDRFVVEVNVLAARFDFTHAPARADLGNIAVSTGQLGRDSV